MGTGRVRPYVMSYPIFRQKIGNAIRFDSIRILFDSKIGYDGRTRPVPDIVPDLVPDSEFGRVRPTATCYDQLPRSGTTLVPDFRIESNRIKFESNRIESKNRGRKIGDGLTLSHSRPVPDPDRGREFYTLTKTSFSQTSH